VRLAACDLSLPRVPRDPTYDLLEPDRAHTKFDTAALVDTARAAANDVRQVHDDVVRRHGVTADE
jgi:hypothetical protein